MDSSTSKPLLHTCKPLRRTLFNRLFAALYTLALAAFFHCHLIHLLNFQTKLLSSLLLLADLILAFQWATTQSFRMRPLRRREFPANLEKSASLIPPVDIFICTADPYKEPPMGVVNTALSVLTYDYPPDKISVYVSDDGGSQLTLFAFLEAARFSAEWVPFCRENQIKVRSPEAYFAANFSTDAQTGKIKALYEEMKSRVEDVIENGKVEETHLHSDKDRSIFNKWTTDFTRQHHPTIIQVLLDKNESKDRAGKLMPNLVYVSREKSKLYHHNFKAGALNTLIRVSAAITNAAIILALDCDMYSNDPETIWRALCYFQDPTTRPTLAYVQFPQIFTGLNKDDIYGCEHKRLFQINPLGFDGFCGPNYVGSNCFFQRRAFFGDPTSLIEPETCELSPTRIVNGSLKSPDVLALARRVSTANYEHQTLWGSKIGIRYGSLVEDYFSGYKLQCEGWRSYFCHPERPAFLGDSPGTLIDMLGQSKRWSIGLLEVLFSKFSPLTYGIRSMGLFMGLAYANYACWPIWSIPLTIYAFIPQIALLNGISIFPKVIAEVGSVMSSLFGDGSRHMLAATAEFDRLYKEATHFDARLQASKDETFTWRDRFEAERRRTSEAVICGDQLKRRADALELSLEAAEAERKDLTVRLVAAETEAANLDNIITQSECSNNQRTQLVIQEIASYQELVTRIALLEESEAGNSVQGRLAADRALLAKTYPDGMPGADLMAPEGTCPHSFCRDPSKMLERWRAAPSCLIQLLEMWGWLIRC